MSDRKIRDAKLHVARGVDTRQMAWEMLWRAHAARDCQYGIGHILNAVPPIVTPPPGPPTATISTEDVRSNP